MTHNQIRSSYEKTIKAELENLSKLKRDIFIVGISRLIVFIASLFMCYLFWGNTLIVIILVVAALVIYLTLAKYHSKLFYRKEYVGLLIKDAENELKALNYDFSAFAGGNEYIDPNHNYSLDLDIFGNKSFFQMINRTVTILGTSILANVVLNPLQLKSDIVLRQQVVAELRQKMDLIKHFRAVAQIGETSEFDIESFSHSDYRKTGFFSVLLPFLAPLLFAGVITLCTLSIFPIGVIPVYWFVMVIFTQLISKNVKRKMDFLDKKDQLIGTYSTLMNIIESEEFNSTILKHMQDDLSISISASKTIRTLRRYCHNMDLSFTFAGVILLNPVFAWNVIFAEKIDKWTRCNRDKMKKWLEVVGLFDSFISLAVFAYNHPDYIFPEVTDKHSIIGKQMKHPMMKSDLCVENDILEPTHPYFMVITGANMAGKSTYLRTVGINLILAEIGSVVSAKSFIFYPFKLVTNLRTSDSLNNNESYFFAELKRLKMIIDQLQSGQDLFIILDEILKGTNSEDKQRGSLALIKQLVLLNGNGIIATHDLELGSLEDEFPSQVKNYRFEADINNDNLTFSYQMKEGVAQNMNACFLMKKMGITIDI